MMEMMMTTTAREKFSSQAAPDVLLAMRRIAESQGRQFQAMLDDALRDYIDRQQRERPRRQVMAAFASSLDDFDHLYRELAK
jgi:predicted transcriptional regulator